MGNFMGKLKFFEAPKFVEFNWSSKKLQRLTPQTSCDCNQNFAVSNHFCQVILHTSSNTGTLNVVLEEAFSDWNRILLWDFLFVREEE